MALFEDNSVAVFIASFLASKIESAKPDAVAVAVFVK